jgi:hypothetical protein
MAHHGASVGNSRFRRLRDMPRDYFNLRVLEYQPGAQDYNSFPHESAEGGQQLGSSENTTDCQLRSILMHFILFYFIYPVYCPLQSGLYVGHYLLILKGPSALVLP